MRKAPLEKRQARQWPRIPPLPALFFLLAVPLTIDAARAQTADTVSIELQGKIEEACRLTMGSNTIDLGSITPAGAHTTSFGIDCNTPFGYTVLSKAGALTQSDIGPLRPGFAGSLPYTLSLAIPTNTGLLSSQCDSARLAENQVTPCGGNSGAGIAIRQTGSLTISWSSSDELVAGTYTDVITLSIQPQL